MFCENYNSDQSFSALRSRLSQDGLDNLTLLTVKHEITEELSYDVILNDFVRDPRKIDVIKCNMQ